MSIDGVCRVCLVNNRRLYHVRNDLQNAYERITREKFNKVGYPASLCFICLSVLKKCDRFMKTARDSNRLLEQWHNQQTEMRVAKPLATYSMTKVQFVSLETEDISSEIDIKTENVELAEQCVVDIQTEYTKCKIDEGTEKKETYDDKKTVVFIINDMNNEWNTGMISKHKTSKDDSPISHDIEMTEVKTEMQTNDEIQLSSGSGIPEDLNTEINIQEIRNNKWLRKKQPIDRMTTHTGENTFSCDTCSFKCARKSNLTRHLRSHTGEKPFLCDICSVRFAQKSHLLRHISTHGGEKPFSCDICGRKYAQKSNLGTHMRSHTGEKPFSCDNCDYKCKLKQKLTDHMRTHTGDKPFLCDICSCKFARKIYLTLHMRSHTGEKPYTCSICSYKCARKSRLTIHLRTHTGETPFSCDICSHKYSQKSHLTRHMRTHTGDKPPFSCHMCTYKCVLKSSLTRHIHKHITTNKLN